MKRRHFYIILLSILGLLSVALFMFFVQVLSASAIAVHDTIWLANPDLSPDELGIHTNRILTFIGALVAPLLALAAVWILAFFVLLIIHWRQRSKKQAAD